MYGNNRGGNGINMSDNYHRPIAATLGFILSPDGESVLMVHRISRSDDENLGKWNGLGGKIERNEDVAAGMIREIREEAGIEVTEMKLRGTVAWTNFGPQKRDWLAFVFLITKFTGEPKSGNEEGPLAWVKLGDISGLPMWDGDRLFVPMVFDEDERPFHGYMPYDGDKPAGWTFTRI